MFCFNRAKILPLFLRRRMTVASLAKAANCDISTANRAIGGKPIHAKSVASIADALEIEAVDFLLVDDLGDDENFGRPQY